MNTDEIPKPHQSSFETDDDEVRLLSGEQISQYGREREGRPGRKGKSQPLFSKLSLTGGTSTITALLRSPRAQRPSSVNKSEFTSSPTLVEYTESSDVQDDEENDSHDGSNAERAETTDESVEEEDDIDSSEAPEFDGTVIRRRRSQQLSKGRRHQRLSRTAKIGTTRNDLEAAGQVDSLSGDSGEGERADKDRSARCGHVLSKSRRHHRRTKPVKKSNSTEDDTENLSADSDKAKPAEDSHKTGISPRRQRSKPVNPRRRTAPRVVRGEASQPAEQIQRRQSRDKM